MSGTWADDPWGRYPYRWHDGTVWTALVFDGRAQYLDPFVVDVDLRATVPSSARSAAAAVTGELPVTPSTPSAAPTMAPPRLPARPTAAGGTSTASASTTPAATTGSATTGAAPVRREGTQPVWVQIVGLLLVAGLVWWLFHLRSGGDDGRSDAASETQASTAGDGPSDSLLGGAATATTLEVVDTVAPTIPPPTTIDTPATLPTATTPALDPSLVDDCVAYTTFAAYLGDSDAAALWSASGMDEAVLRDLCAALPVERLVDLSARRDQTDLLFTGSTAPVSSTTSIAPMVTSADGSTVPVSPTVPPPLPTTTG